MIVVRYTKENIPVISKPCLLCLKHIIDIGVRRVYYFNENGEIECKKPYDINGKVSSGVSCMLSNNKITKNYLNKIK